MADIVNPNALKFLREQLRPLCEAVRDLKPMIAAMETDWFGGLNLVLTNTADLVVDGRAAEGVSQLTGAQVTAAVGVLIAVAGAVNDEIIAKPCVKPMRVS